MNNDFLCLNGMKNPGTKAFHLIKTTSLFCLGKVFLVPTVDTEPWIAFIGRFVKPFFPYCTAMMHKPFFSYFIKSHGLFLVVRRVGGRTLLCRSYRSKHEGT